MVRTMHRVDSRVIKEIESARDDAMRHFGDLMIAHYVAYTYQKAYVRARYPENDPAEVVLISDEDVSYDPRTELHIERIRQDTLYLTGDIKCAERIAADRREHLQTV